MPPQFSFSTTIPPPVSQLRGWIVYGSNRGDASPPCTRRPPFPSPAKSCFRPDSFRLHRPTALDAATRGTHRRLPPSVFLVDSFHPPETRLRKCSSCLRWTVLNSSTRPLAKPTTCASRRDRINGCPHSRESRRLVSFSPDGAPPSSGRLPSQNIPRHRLRHEQAIRQELSFGNTRPFAFSAHTEFMG